MGYYQYTIPDTAAVEPTFVAFLEHSQHNKSMASHAILSNLFEEQWTQNHPQYFSGLSRALLPTTFLEVALCIRGWRLLCEKDNKTNHLPVRKLKIYDLRGF